jgi:hypothetical protein
MRRRRCARASSRRGSSGRTRGGRSTSTSTACDDRRRREDERKRDTHTRLRFCPKKISLQKTDSVEACAVFRVCLLPSICWIWREIEHCIAVACVFSRGVSNNDAAKFDMSDDDDRGAASEAGATPRDRGSTGESRRVRVRSGSRETWTRAARSAARVDRRGRSSTDSAFHFGALLRSRPRRGEARTPVDVRHDGAGELLVGFYARRP